MQVVEHGGWRGGVAGIAGPGFVEGGFVAIEAGDGVADGAEKLGECGRAAEAGEEEVCGGVVAKGDGGEAEFGDGHAVGAGVLLGHGGVGDEVGCGEDDPAVEVFPSLLYPLKDEGGGGELEGAAHGKALGCAMSE